MGTLLLATYLLFIGVAADLYDDPNTLWNRPTMVHLFEWKWTDIANECESFLQHFAYGAVQISPPNEHITLTQNKDMPWWVRYQPVSYKIISRSGNEEQFRDMVDRCNKVGIRIVVEVVLNNMVMVGQKQGVDGRNSSGGSFYNGMEGKLEFPEVPYSKTDFNDNKCSKNVKPDDYRKSASRVRNCRVRGLLDLDQSKPVVQKKLIEYLDHLIDTGVAGFCFHESKHMWPDDLKTIQHGMKNLREDIFGKNKRPFVVHEVNDRGGEAIRGDEYTDIGRITNFNYGPIVSKAAKGNFSWGELRRFGPAWSYGNLADNDVLNFIDNQDSQRRGDVVTHKSFDQYELAVSFMLAWSYGYPRVMSSFYFENYDQGPPSTGIFEITSPSFNTDFMCKKSSGWVCEHRWPSIREMVRFRSLVQGAPVVEFVYGHGVLAFARKGKGFFAINGLGRSWVKSFNTTLPEGYYCNVYTGISLDGRCTGNTVYVDKRGMTKRILVAPGILAISLASKISSPQQPLTTIFPTPPATQTAAHERTMVPVSETAALSTTETSVPSTPSPPVTLSRTVILLKRHAAPSQDVFIRGGLAHTNSNVCPVLPYQQQYDRCALPVIHGTVTPSTCSKYAAWSIGDKYLDFDGPEIGQGVYNGTEAAGTPTVQTTNDPSKKEYHPLNRYGSSYWLVELLIDCSKTDNGWFELKGLTTAPIGWESDIKQGTCTGNGGSAPFQSTNHIAKCGAVNVFKWGYNDCFIEVIPDPTLAPVRESTKGPVTDTKRPLAPGTTQHPSPQTTEQSEFDNTPTTTRIATVPVVTAPVPTVPPLLETSLHPVTLTRPPPMPTSTEISTSKTTRVELLDTTEPSRPKTAQPLFPETSEQTTEMSVSATTREPLPATKSTEILIHKSTRAPAAVTTVPSIPATTPPPAVGTTEPPFPETTSTSAAETTDPPFQETTPTPGAETIEPPFPETTPAPAVETTDHPLPETTREPPFTGTTQQLLPETTKKLLTTTNDISETRTLQPRTRHPFTPKSTQGPVRDTNSTLSLNPEITSTTFMTEPSTPSSIGLSRTLIFLKRDTSWKQHVFIRGGVSHLNNNECSPGPYQQPQDPCAVPIKHVTAMPASCPPSSCLQYRAWSRGDTFLDFEGPEIAQGRYNGTEAFGTPCLWTTSNPSQDGFNPFNKYGYAYWLADLLIDCNKTDNGWFELKGFMPSIGLEPDVKQGECAGEGDSAPFQSKSHVARCGAVNVFYWGSGACQIDAIPETSIVPAAES